MESREGEGMGVVVVTVWRVGRKGEGVGGKRLWVFTNDNLADCKARSDKGPRPYLALVLFSLYNKSQTVWCF